MSTESTSSSSGDDTAVAAVPPHPLGRWYLVAMATSVFGAALGFLAITGASTFAGGTEHAGLYTAIVTSVVALVSAWGTARTPQACRRQGALKLLFVSEGVLAAVLVVGGAALTLGAPIMPVLLVVAVPLGFAGGVVGVLSPGFSRTLLRTATTSQAYAKAGMVAGLAYAAGSLVGGFLLKKENLGFGLVANALLLIPLLMLLRRIDPADSPPAPKEARGAWASARQGLAASRALRLVALMALFVGLLVLPFQSLVTPIVGDLRPSASLLGAGGVLAGLSLGLMVSPQVVKRLTNGSSELAAMVQAGLAVGVFIALFGAAGALPVGLAQLLLMIAVAFAAGAVRQAYLSLRAGVASDARGGEHGIEDMATVTLVGRAVMPVGVVVWGIALDIGGASRLLIGAGILMLVAAVLLLRPARRVAPSAGEGAGAS